MVTDVFLRRLAGRFARQHVTTFVLRVAGVALDPFPFYLVALNGQIQPLPQIDILDRLLSAVFQPRFFQLWIQLVMPWRTYWLSVLSVTAQGTVSASSATIAAIISMRLLVVRRKPSLKVFPSAYSVISHRNPGAGIAKAGAIGENFYLFEHLW